MSGDNSAAVFAGTFQLRHRQWLFLQHRPVRYSGQKRDPRPLPPRVPPSRSVPASRSPLPERSWKRCRHRYRGRYDEKARETYGGAQEVQNQLAGMEDAARTLNESNWSSTGTGGNARLALAKTVDGIWQTLGVKDQNLPFDPDAVASWEKLTKETTRLGFGLARTLGAREAMQIVQGAIKANPNVENTAGRFPDGA